MISEIHSVSTVGWIDFKLQLSLFDPEDVRMFKEEFSCQFFVVYTKSHNTMKHFLFRAPSHHTDVDWRLKYIPHVIECSRPINIPNHLSINKYILFEKDYEYKRCGITIVGIDERREWKFCPSILFPKTENEDGRSGVENGVGAPIIYSEITEDIRVNCDEDYSYMIDFMKMDSTYILSSDKRWGRAKGKHETFQVWYCDIEDHFSKKNEVFTINLNKEGKNAMIIYDPERNRDVMSFINIAYTNPIKLFEGRTARDILYGTEGERMSHYDSNKEYVNFHREYMARYNIAVVDRFIVDEYFHKCD